ncbi:MAG: hypothetical protein H9843_03365 [Candidatus Limosilactobacillus merdavium]|uniref:Uncharacterized protein n=1 Tax=Candidatus Limosilactobacillus merdavium TaxID=2838651 RepID=A0A9E2KVH9_9LACO|nr:hypothetical protein [Candidatus Limosilactobacillus merdavium]
MLEVTTVYVQNSKATQEFNCSDGSTGVMEVEDTQTTPTYYFRFYAHSHPSFRLADNEFHDGEEITIMDILDNEDVALKFV